MTRNRSQNALIFADCQINVFRRGFNFASSHGKGTMAMREGRMLVERREQKRCYLHGEGVAVALLKSAVGKSTVVGEIIDISAGGAAFRYISAQPASDAPSELSLVSADHSFYLGNLPITTISDLEQAKIPFGGISTRRRGVKFGVLRQSQQFALQHFIRNYTVGESETH